MYERFSKYDPTTKRSRKVSGKCLGKITPEGFVQTKRRLTPEADQSSPSVRRVSDVAEAGAVMFFWNRTAAMRERLKAFFPDLWQTIYAAAILRAIKEPRFRRLQAHYETSLIAHLMPDLSFDAPSNTAFLQALGPPTGKHLTLHARGCQKERCLHSLRWSPLDYFVQNDGIGRAWIRLQAPFQAADQSALRLQPRQRLHNPCLLQAISRQHARRQRFSDVLNECGISSSKYTVIADKGFAF